MKVKVVKFGGSSLADAEHFKQVASIIKADPQRRYVVPSAPGKRFKDDTKGTDMLYECYEKIRNHESIEELYAKISERYIRSYCWFSLRISENFTFLMVILWIFRLIISKFSFSR